MAKADPEELMNAYDNTIVYTDYLLHSVIEMLRGIPERRSCMIFVSDHGESLGEGNLYMHGVPMLVAPKEQIEIPFIVWTSDEELQTDPTEKAGQYHVFHSILSFLGIESPVYDASGISSGSPEKHPKSEAPRMRVRPKRKIARFAGWRIERFSVPGAAFEYIKSY